jgi:dihydrofolate reductase
MRSVIYSMSVSLDGYIAGPDGSFDWTTPDEEVFRFFTDQTRELASAVEGNARLASGSLVEEIERLRGEPGDGDIGIGGATLAGEAAQLGLIDEFRSVVYPVVVAAASPSTRSASAGSILS